MTESEPARNNPPAGDTILLAIISKMRHHRRVWRDDSMKTVSRRLSGTGGGDGIPRRPPTISPCRRARDAIETTRRAVETTAPQEPQFRHRDRLGENDRNGHEVPGLVHGRQFHVVSHVHQRVPRSPRRRGARVLLARDRPATVWFIQKKRVFASDAERGSRRRQRRRHGSGHPAGTGRTGGTLDTSRPRRGKVPRPIDRGANGREMTRGVRVCEIRVGRGRRLANDGEGDPIPRDRRRLARHASARRRRTGGDRRKRPEKDRDHAKHILIYQFAAALVGELFAGPRHPRFG